MKLLIIISGHLFDIKNCENIKMLNDFMQSSDTEVDYCGISNQDDFSNYENIISFKYKIINQKYQLSKICDFITDYKSELNYDWYVKIRPDVKLLEQIDFNILSKNAINARARIYKGPSQIKYGMTINGEGPLKNVGDCYYADFEEDILIDDQIYIFHNNLVNLNAFDKIDDSITEIQNETLHTKIFKKREIALNIIGIYACFTRNQSYSGHINM
jgi:hypothetical protein